MTVRRTWLITGVTRGFGRVFAEQLLARGDRVAGTVRQMDLVDDLKQRYGDLLWLSRLDLADTRTIRGVVDHAFSDLTRIDVVVNNAGYGLLGAAEEVSYEQLVEQIATNFTGSIEVVRAALPHLRRQGGGRILQVSTMGGQVAIPGASSYVASKWGIEGFMDSTALDVAPFGIGVTIVEPGAARTGFRARGLKIGAKNAAYTASPAHISRQMMLDETTMSIGDPAKMVAAMINSVEITPAPRRLVLGSDAYNGIRKALMERVAALDAQKEIAFSTDFPPDD